MTQVIVSLYDRSRTADKVMKALHGAGFDSSQIDCIEGAANTRTLFRRGLFVDGRAETIDPERARQALAELGIPEDEASHYAGEIRGGKSMVIVHSDDEIAGRAKHIMNRFPAEKLDQISSIRREGSWAEPRSSSSDQSDMEILRELAREHEVTDEEDTEMESTPDTEQRERDRPAPSSETDENEEQTPPEPASTGDDDVSSAPSAAEDEQRIKESMERSERPGQVGSPDSPLGELATSHAQARFRVYEPEFRRHYEQHYAPIGTYRFEEYSRAYRYGLALAEDASYRRHDWPTVEREAGRQWDSLMDHPWSEFREAARFGWYRIRGEEEKFGGRPSRS